jgi:type I restriction enzyme S subunit
VSGLPSGWIETTLGDACSILAGYGFPERLQGRSQGDLAFFKVGDISESWKRGEPVLANANHYISFADAEELRAAPLPANTVVFAKIGAAIALNRRALLSVPSLVDNNVMGLHQQPELLNPKYLFHFACTLRLDDLSRATTVPSLRKGDVASLRFPLAPFAEQERIVAEIEKQFTRLDAAVAALKRVQSNLKRYRAAVLKAACEGNLVPTEAELARKEGRSYETGEHLLARILKERRAKWEADHLAKMKAAGKLSKEDWKKKYKEPEGPDSGALPPLPEGWSWATWDQIGFSQNGRPFPSAEYCNDGVKLIRPGNLHVSGRVQWDEENTRRMPESWERENPDLVVGSSELVMNLTAQSLRDEFLGRICITSADEHCLLNQRLARLTPMLVHRRFVLWLLKSSIFRRFVDGLNTGSLIQHMFTSQLARFILPLPPLQEQERIAAEVEAKLSVVDQNEAACEKASRAIDALRQSILKRAFEGKLVPQDPNDEHASVLLERLLAERKNRQPVVHRRSRKVAQRTFLVEAE